MPETQLFLLRDKDDMIGEPLNPIGIGPFFFRKLRSQFLSDRGKKLLVLLLLILPDNQCDFVNTRINQAVESFGYSNTKDLDILFIEVRDVADLGGGLLLADVHYKTVITALNGPVEVEDQAQVVLRWVDGELLADALYHY